jgi:hypothetical protein
MRILRSVFLALFAAAMALAQTTSGWKLVWSDEFNGAAGAAPDPRDP